MNGINQDLVIRRQTWDANLTDANSLGKALMIAPEKIASVYHRIFSSKDYYSNNPLSSMLFGKSMTEQYVNGTEWTFNKSGATTRPTVCLENVEPVDNTTPGKFKRPFKIKLDENFYLPGDYIHPGNVDYQVRIVDRGVEHGNGYVYTVVMASGKPEDFMPVRYLTNGQKWGKLFSKYEEAAEQSGSTLFTTPMAMRNSMSLYRKEYRITNWASTIALTVDVPGPDGKMYRFWQKYAEVEYWRQWYKELERGIWYSKFSKDVIGANGRPVLSGPGIKEQLKDANSRTYTHLTARLLEEFIMDAVYGVTAPGGNQEIVGFTGEYGMMAFHRAVNDTFANSGFIKNIEIAAKPTSSPYHQNALEAGYQFVKYHLGNGRVLKLVHNPLYDDRDIHFDLDPITGKPKESMRITFLNLGGQSDMEPNIKLMKKKDGFAFAYVEGLYGPYGPKKNTSAAHAGSYYEMHVEDTFGVQIDDTSMCGELIFERD